jgi:uncharacterized protein YprB with RNaseH-like and TPR domain
VIYRENVLNIEKFSTRYSLMIDNNRELFKDSVFFDLEHYVYKKPICIGVFGCCYFDETLNKLKVTQYMIENKKDSDEILKLAEKYFTDMLCKKNKKYIVTFSGNNDFTVINYLFKQNQIEFNFEATFKQIDLQKEYEKVKKVSIGLKNLEKEFNISRDSALISGQNLAKTFSKIVKDSDYILRMPDEKKEKILLYNEQDVVSLFHIYVNWDKIIKIEEEQKEEPKIEETKAN